MTVIADVETKTEQTSEYPVVLLVWRLVGVAAMAAAIGLWVLPGSATGDDVALMKMGVTAFLGMIGAVFYLTGARR